MTSFNSEEHEAIRDSVRKFITRECPEVEVARWDSDDFISRDVLTKLGELGVCGLTIDEEYGGLGKRVVDYIMVLEELSRCSTAISGIYQMAAGYAGLNISALGTDEQKAMFLPKVAVGKICFALGLSEPDVGADLATVTTRADRNGDTLLINGNKRWCSGANVADYIYTLVRTGPAEDRRRNLSFVLIPVDTKGITMTETATMGGRGCATNDVNFDNVEVPVTNIVGGEDAWNQGWKQLAGPSLEVEKLGPAAISLGIAEAAVDEAWQYSQERRQFGVPICAHQAVRHVLADSRTKLLTMRLMLNNAAQLVEEGKDSAVATSMAKLYICETAKDVVLACQQHVMGAYGYAEGFSMERYVRDILGPTIYGGSSAIQRNNLANLLKLPRG